MRTVRSRGCADLAGQADQVDRQLPARWRRGHACPRHFAGHLRGDQAAGHSRKSSGGERGDRRRCGRQVARRRLHVPRHVRRRDDRRSVHLFESSLRHAEGLDAGGVARDRARFSDGSSLGAREKHQRVRRLRARQSRKTLLRVGGQRELSAHRGGDVQARGQDRRNPRSVQGRCAGAQRPAGRAGPVHVRSRSGPAACGYRQVNGARRRERQARFTISRCPHARRAGHACRR